MKNFRTTLLTAMALGITPALFAQNSVNPSNGVGGWGLIAAAFVLGVAAAGGALGQGRAIAAACEGIARNPGAAGPIRLALIIGLALIESLVIYCLIIAFIAVNK
ncbi:MAG: ATP synthase F0 subunit C [Acidobacteriota bacterium]